MTDGVIKGVGNSRYLKSVPSFLSLYPTYEAFAEALIAGTLPIDLNGINEAGWSQLGTALNKANLLSDATAALFSLGTDAALNDALAAIKTLIDSANTTASSKAKIKTGTYTGTGGSSSGITKTISFGFTPTVVFIGGADGNSSPLVYVRVGTAGGNSLVSGFTGGSSGPFRLLQHNAIIASTSLSWTVYSGYEAINCNVSGVTYYYTAIG